jgi:hypothetical protein
VAWEALAPALDLALEAGAGWDADDTAGAFAASNLPPEVLGLARACGVLSFATSARVAEQFARAVLQNRLAAVLETPGEKAPGNGPLRVTLWNVKEGHTSSVWKVSLEGYNRRDTAFALNVARDAAANDELLRSADVLRIAGANAPEGSIARVLLVDQARIPTEEPERVLQAVVVAQEWIQDARELGYVTDRVTGEQHLFAIDRFLTDAESPGRIVSVAGQRITGAERDKVLLEIFQVILSAANWQEGRLRLPAFEMNQGDWVLQGSRPVLVAASGTWFEPGPGEALEAALVRLFFGQSAGTAAPEWLSRQAAAAVHWMNARQEIPAAAFGTA